MTTKTQVIVPTAINMVTFVNDAILASRRQNAPMSVNVPTLRERAKLIVNGTGSMHIVVDDGAVDPATFTR
jgi:hypothetical protein